MRIVYNDTYSEWRDSVTTAAIIFIMAVLICAAFLFLMHQKNKGDIFGGPYYLDGEEDGGEAADCRRREGCGACSCRDEMKDRGRETSEDENEAYERGPGEGENEPEEETVMIRDEDFVNVKEYIDDIEVDLKYASQDNFTGQVIYDFDEAFLRYGTVKKLALVQERLKREGYRMKIWDAFRPVSAQFKLWEVCPDDTFVANPNTGYSSHSRGNTVDITLVHMDGGYVEMPTEFDDFSEQAKRTCSEGVSEEAEKNSLLMEKLMEECGFEPYVNEWWHFSDRDEYPVEENFLP